MLEQGEMQGNEENEEMPSRSRIFEDDFLDSEEEETPFETERPQSSSDTRRQSDLIERIISANFDLDLGDETTKTQFLADYRPCFIGGEDSTLIHMALRSCDDSVQLDRLKPLFALIVGEYPEILEVRNSMAETTLHYAIQQKLSDAAEYLCRCAPREAAAKAISCRGRSGGNCLHAAIQSHLKITATEYLISVCEPDAAVAVDDLGRTPLHYIVGEAHRPSAKRATVGSDSTTAKREHRSPRSPDLVRLLVEKNDMVLRSRDAMGRTPYQQRVSRLESKMARAKQRKNDTMRRAAEHYARVGRSAIERAKGDMLDYVSPPLVGRKPLDMEPLRGGSKRMAEEHYSNMIRRGGNITVSKSSSWLNPKPSNTEQSGSDTADLQPNLRELVRKDHIASFILLYCMRTFSPKEIIECLYGSSQERQIEFDLSGLPTKSISEDYLDRLSKHLQFERVLKYVVLPRLTVEASAKFPVSRERARNGGGGNLVPVFNWLRLNGVEKILKVTVVDDKEPAHTDSNIEEALHHFDIEIWDWRRLDVSSEVIYTVAPRAKEIHLYSSGNNAVLMGWASPEGLPKFAELKIVNISVQKGRESIGRLEGYLRVFSETLAARTSGRLKVRHMIVGDDDVGFASSVENKERYMQAETPWVDCIRNFVKLLYRAPMSKEIQPIKIGVIDDGIDGSLTLFEGKIAAGKSFHYTTSGLISPYFISPTGHGTLMCTIIATLCPNASLYIAKLDREHSNFKELSEAICWATDHGVDMIVFSGIIYSLKTDQAGVMDVAEAASRATKREIMMFCAANDSGSHVHEPSYLGRCVRIGGETRGSAKFAGIDTAGIDFILPGDYILPFHHETGLNFSNVTGHPVATAIAASLAGFLLFCSRFLGDDKYGEWLAHGGMRFAFKTMAEGRDGKFPVVQEFFERRFMRELRSGKEPAREQNGHGITDIEWDEDCTKALKVVMDSLKGGNLA
ncbi:putative peptidase S8 subtilisin kexin [Rosellinia necatrix]|uniref:Putative peptidase S8 subtilisin kexin n=1 Tax=Rosellinia necatrix TaxID=77044 RepID=A0A1W2TKH2_ROSNE|nr:putative peptidase S8 subtilisin kexin [Rosellinia necatrix]